MIGPDERLTGGNVAAEVFRVGPTVRKPATRATPAVTAYLQHLKAAGFEGSPEHLGLDETGRQILEYVPGVTADRMVALNFAELHRLGQMIRRLHDLAATFEAPPGARWDVVIPPDHEDLVCHHDLAPWNLVREGDRWVFIDWDGAGPGSRLWDLAYAAHGFVGMHHDGDPAADGLRLRALIDGYGLTEVQRRRLPDLITAHVRGMYDLLRDGHLTGRQPGLDCGPTGTANTGARPRTTATATLGRGHQRYWSDSPSARAASRSSEARSLSAVVARARVKRFSSVNCDQS